MPSWLYARSYRPRPHGMSYEQIMKLAQSLSRAYLEACLEGRECNCITIEEHERNVRRARELGLDKKQ